MKLFPRLHGFYAIFRKKEMQHASSGDLSSCRILIDCADFIMQMSSCFYAVKPRMVYNARIILASAKKDSVPTAQKNCVVYEFSYQCDVCYGERTTRKLADKIKQHVPTSIRKKSRTIRE